MRWIFLVLFFLIASTAQAQEWNRFRGPNGTGISPEKMPIQWAANDYLWNIKLPGNGYSSPVAWQHHVFVTASDDKIGTRFVLCIDANNGKTLWQRDFAGATYKLHKRNSIATATPTVDADRLYLAWATPQHYVVQALDRKTGADVWQIDLGPYVSQHGFGASPILYEDLLILCNEQDKKGRLHAVKASTGKEVWRLPRNSGNATYSVPCIYQVGKRPAEMIFTNWKHGITGVDPRTGKVKWELSVFEPKKQERAIVSPLIAGDLILGTCGFVTGQKHFVAVRPTGDGKATEIWRMEKAVAYMPTPICKGDRIFSCSELGLMRCLDSATGKVIWEERLDGEFSASPVCAGSAIYCTSNTGEVYVVEAADTFKLLARNQLPGATQSTPAIAAGRLIFRTHGRLLAVAPAK